MKGVVAESTTPQELVEAFTAKLVDMVWRAVAEYAELSGREPAMTPHVAYGVLDGLFQQSLLGYTCGKEASSTSSAPRCAG